MRDSINGDFIGVVKDIRDINNRPPDDDDGLEVQTTAINHDIRLKNYVETRATFKHNWKRLLDFFRDDPEILIDLLEKYNNREEPPNLSLLIRKLKRLESDRFQNDDKLGCAMILRQPKPKQTPNSGSTTKTTEIIEEIQTIQRTIAISCNL